MKYLSSEPFSIFLNSPREEDPIELQKRDKLRKQPHEYINGGGMCSLCGLGDQAAIHAHYNSYRGPFLLDWGKR